MSESKADDDDNQCCIEVAAKYGRHLVELHIDKPVDGKSFRDLAENYSACAEDIRGNAGAFIFYYEGEFSDTVKKDLREFSKMCQSCVSGNIAEWEGCTLCVCGSPAANIGPEIDIYCSSLNIEHSVSEELADEAGFTRGLARIKEALENVPWTSSSGSGAMAGTSVKEKSCEESIQPDSLDDFERLLRMIRKSRSYQGELDNSTKQHILAFLKEHIDQDISESE